MDFSREEIQGTFEQRELQKTWLGLDGMGVGRGGLVSVEFDIFLSNFYQKNVVFLVSSG